MQINCSAAKVWMACEPVDFRKSINGLSALATAHNASGDADQIYVFYNRAKNKLKLLGYHRNGYLMLYKQLDKKRFTVPQDNKLYCTLSQDQLSWLLAGLDWAEMSLSDAPQYRDFY